jgi:hypothetical protein
LAGRQTLQQRRGATPEELRQSRIDIVIGMLFSNLIALIGAAQRVEHYEISAYTNVNGFSEYTV